MGVVDVKVTPVFAWNYKSRSRYVINQGGSSSSKTFSVLQVLAFRAMQKPGTVITVTAESLPALRKGAIRDFDKIRTSFPLSMWVTGINKSTNTYTFENGSIMEFVSFPDEEGAKHGKRNYLFMNEANHVSYDVARQLIMRTSEQVYIDFNPTSDFWAHEKYLAESEAQWFYSTYLDNPFCPETVIKEIEALRGTSPEHYKVYGLGLRGSLSGQVFTGINYAPELPPRFHESRYGLDFGFTNSYTALCKIGLSDGRVWGKELMYERGLTEPEILKRLHQLEIPKWETIVADSANPMLIQYLRDTHYIDGETMGGYNVVGAQKIDIKDGIEAMKRYQWNVTDDSTNWKKEAKNYIYRKAKGGGLDNTPVKEYDHLWDAARYAFLDMVNVNELPRFL